MSSFRVYQVAKLLEGDDRLLPPRSEALLASVVSTEVIEVLEDQPALRAKYIELYELLEGIGMLREKREWLRARGYPVKNRLDECDEEIWQKVARFTVLSREYEMFRKLCAYKIEGLKIKG